MKSTPGHEIIHGLCSRGECDDVVSHLSETSEYRSRAGIRHLMSNAHVASLASDSRLLALANEWLAADILPFRATLFDKSAQTNWLIPWHQDTALPLLEQFENPRWGPWSTKGGVIYAHAPSEALSNVVALRLHLDPATPDNGPLRVIPESHTKGVVSDDEIDRHAKSHAPVECLLPRGSVLIMRPLHIHSSSKAPNAEPRRVLHTEYATRDLAREIPLAVV